MGRRQHLARLALGRSAFDTDSDTQDHAGSDSVIQRRSDSSNAYVQQYDAKGRPVNPAIEDFNSDLRDAQNAVLELVGVVERKDKPDQFAHRRRGHLRAQRTALLSQEDEYGEMLHYATMPVVYLAKLWVNVLQERVQIGYYGPSLSMTDILASESRALFCGGLKAFLENIFPALSASFVLFCTKTVLVIVVEQITGRLQCWLDGGWLPHRTVARMYTATSWLFEHLLFLIDAAFLPLELHATAQRLGLAPLSLTLPSLTSFWPSSPDSFHRYGWQPVISTSIIRQIASPGVLMLCNKVFNGNLFEGSTPLMRFFTAFRYPQINEDHASPSFLRHNPTSQPPFPFLGDPIGWLMNKEYTLRQNLLAYCGWTIIIRPLHHHHHDTFRHDVNTILPDERAQPGNHNDLDEHHRSSDSSLATALPIHRSTNLAHLSAKTLASFTDQFFFRIVLLPFQSLLLRTIATSYLATPFTPKTGSAITSSTSLYCPFGGSPLFISLCSPASSTAWSALATYTSRLTLAVALNATIDTFLFFAVNSTARYIGVRYCHWGETEQVDYNHRGDEITAIDRRVSTDNLTGRHDQTQE